MPSTGRRRASTKLLVTGLALAVGAITAGAVPPSHAGTAPAPAPAWSPVADGFAGVDALGQRGTTGGAGGQTVTVRTQQELTRYATASQPYVIRVQGAITLQPKGTEIKVQSDKTIVGVGTSGHIVQGGFFLGAGVHNVIIRNLTIRDAYVDGDEEGKTQDFDAIQLDGAHHVWIDHNRLTRMGDGLIDSRKDTSYLTVSYNVLHHHNKAFGIGWTTNVTARMTIHHNWIHDTKQRNPSVDNVAYAHLYNNYLSNVASYGNFARGATRMVLENSYFANVRDPYFVEAGQLRESGSVVVGGGWTAGRTKTRGSAFDPRTFYPYTLDRAADLPTLLPRVAGPQAGIG